MTIPKFEIHAVVTIQLYVIFCPESHYAASWLKRQTEQGKEEEEEEEGKVTF
jgi:hypothetical protein